MVVGLIYIFLIEENFKPDSIKFNLDSVYYWYEATMPDTGIYESSFKPVLSDTSKKDKDNLRISGVKDFSYDMTQGFDQGLKVDISGDIEGIGIEGNLSDKATPSSTVPISDVEKISLKIFTKHFYGGIGNLTLDLPFGIQEEMQGGRIGIYSTERKNNVHVSYAIKRGVYRRIQITGEEGKQSPYLLEGVPIAGSERVYLAQGIDQPILLTRDDDYTIDYERGIISFTNKNIITNYSRIEVAYQQAIEDYSNIYQETDGRYNFGNFIFQGLYRRKYDEKENPLSFIMTPVMIESLEIVGDSSSILHTYADTSTQGSYNLEDDHYVYVGEGNGNYIVAFFYVGEGNGEYIYDPDLKAFSYKGPGLGNYSPKKILPLPQKDEFYGLGVNIFETLNLNLYGSNIDKNTFSPIDDEDNQGYGYRANINRTIKMFSINGEYIKYSDNFFTPIGREIIDYQYIWQTSEPLKELGNLSLGIYPKEFLKLNFGFGILNRKHKRKYLKFQPLFFEFGYEGVDSLEKYFAGFSKKLARFSLRSRYEFFEQFQQFNYGVKYSLSKNSGVGLSGNYDKDTTNTGLTSVFNLETPIFTFSLGHRKLNDTTFIFGNATMNFASKGISIYGNIQQSQRYSQKRDEAYIKVEEGKGNYVYDSITGAYIEKSGGNYTKKVILLPEFDRVITRNYSFDAGYTKEIFSLNGRFYYVDEKDFLNHSEDVLLTIGHDIYDFTLNFRQDITEDARYALLKTYRYERLFSFVPSYSHFSGRVEVSEKIEKEGAFERERKNSYGGELGYDIIKKPLVRPKIGYSFSKIFSQYFEDLELLFHAPKANLLFGLPIKNNRGRLELSGELIYRIYNLDDVPYFFTAAAPKGLTKILNTVVSFGFGVNTVFSLVYRIEFPPAEKSNQNLRFQTRIRF